MYKIWLQQILQHNNWIFHHKKVLILVIGYIYGPSDQYNYVICSTFMATLKNLHQPKNVILLIIIYIKKKVKSFIANCCEFLVIFSLLLFDNKSTYVMTHTHTQRCIKNYGRKGDFLCAERVGSFLSFFFGHLKFYWIYNE